MRNVALTKNIMLSAKRRHSRVNVVVISEVRGDTRRYRALHLIEQLIISDIPCEFVHLADPRIWKTIDQPWTVAIFHRVAYGDHIGKILEKLCHKGSIVISDFDDLIFDSDMFAHINSPDFADPIRSEIYLQNMRNIRAMLDHSEGVLASTDFLSERIASLGKPVWTHRNAFSLEMLACSEKARAKKTDHQSQVVIGYASGTPTHNRDFELVKPALQAVMRRYPQVMLRLVGPLDPGSGWEGLESRIDRLKLVPWRKLPDILADFDINLAPLVMDNPFAQSKSEIKYMEAAMVETPTIASATDAFRFAIRSGETGLLVDSPQGWETAIEDLVRDSNLRSRMGKQAYQVVTKEYHPVTRAEQLTQTLDEISQRLRGRSFWQGSAPQQSAIAARAQAMKQGRRWLPKRYEKDPSNLELGVYSLRHRGWKTLARQVWIYLRRLLAPIFPFR